ncbi:hypothetical protein N7478_002736 [Penicillium angulare]|uniref:uncharacterized protein n=1 Tax=Penicillium angulare TaxID=116970 RepID=UPI002541BC3F|nr:uncharacterized protein N7478_002736 [Penicillium angulare]KAJ5287050.1 hypothetical protein N7478_002736 [Penicillium angulare]
MKEASPYISVSKSPWLVPKRSTACSSIIIETGDTCDTLAAKCGITTSEFSTYNTDSSLCTSLTSRQPVCCSSGTLELPLEASDDGICYIHTVQPADTCDRIATAYGITVDDLETYNKDTWEYDWIGCSKGLVGGAFICLSSGSPPMPHALPNAICGPQVPGTARPSDMSDLASLNPCIAPDCQCVLSNGLCGNTVDENSGCPTGSVSTSTVPTTLVSSKVQSTSSSKSTSDVIAITTADWTTTKHSSTSTSTQDASTSSSTTKSTTKRDSDSDYAPWEVAIYSEEDCSGDYYVLSGSNQDYGNCLYLHGNSISSKPSSSGTWCRWFTNGGLDSNDCDAGTITTPTSWYLSGICQVFTTTDCSDPDGTSQSYTSAESSGDCANYKDNVFQVSPWGSMKCGGIYEL